MFDVLQESCEQLEYAREIRRHLHKHPEPSSYELETVAYIASHLKSLKIPFVSIPDGGILAEIDSGRPGRTVLLRADCDALRMQEAEQNAKKKKVCVSEVPGVAHTCGHDAHTAMLLAAGSILMRHRDAFSGKILLLFERGEEGGLCIYYVMKYIQEQNIAVDGCYSNHVTADFPAGVVGIANGPTNAAMFGFDIVLHGEGGHGSRPDRANNPIHCFVAIMNLLNDFRVRCTDPFQAITFDVCTVESGSAANVIPDTLRFSGTARYFDRATGDHFRAYLKKTVDTCAAFYGCCTEYLQFREGCPPAVTEAHCSALAKQAARRFLPAENVRDREPRLGSETFAFLTAYYPGARGVIGARNDAEGVIYNNHHPGFEIDEDALIYGMMMYIAYALEFLQDTQPLVFEPFPEDIDGFFASMNAVPPERHDPLS